MNSSPSDLMSYCSWAKKNSSYRESIGDSFYGVIFYYREYFTFTYTIGDALKGGINENVGHSLPQECHCNELPKVNFNFKLYLFCWKTFYKNSFSYFLVFGSIKKKKIGQQKTLIKIRLIFYRLFSKKKIWKTISLSHNA